jgi:hypothetical protein
MPQIGKYTLAGRRWIEKLKVMSLGYCFILKSGYEVVKLGYLLDNW